MNNPPYAQWLLRSAGLLCAAFFFTACSRVQVLQTEVERLDREISALRLEMSRLQHRRQLALNEMAGYPPETLHEDSMRKLDQDRKEAETRLQERQKEYDHTRAELTSMQAGLKIYTQTYVKPSR